MPEKKVKKPSRVKKADKSKKVVAKTATLPRFSKGKYIGDSQINIYAVDLRLAGNNCDNKELVEFLEIIAKKDQKQAKPDVVTVPATTERLAGNNWDDAELREDFAMVERQKQKHMAGLSENIRG